MITANTTTTKKAFALSLAFHTFMALCALGILYTAPSRPDNTFVMPIKHITIVTAQQSSAALTPHIEPETPKVTRPVPEPPRPQPVVQPKPMPQTPVVRTPPLPAANPAPATPPAEAKPTPTPAAVSAPAQSPVKAPKADLAAEKNSFYASLRSQIKRQLRYPSAARRRGMEGNVMVHFLLEQGGTIRDITVVSGESIFHNAAKAAVASASGVKIPAAIADSFPEEMNLELEFNLKNGS